MQIVFYWQLAWAVNENKKKCHSLSAELVYLIV